MWDGNIRLTTPMLFCIGGISTFIIGGVTGIFLASVPVNQLFHGTYYVVGHFHLIITGVIPFTIFAATYFWYPLVTRRIYNETLAKLHFWLSFVGVHIAFNTLIVLGAIGMPRRSATYPVEFAPLQIIATAGACFSSGSDK